MARDHLFKVSWERGEKLCHGSKESEARSVAVEYMLAMGVIKVEEIDQREVETAKS